MVTRPATGLASTGRALALATVLSLPAGPARAEWGPFGNLISPRESEHEHLVRQDPVGVSWKTADTESLNNSSHLAGRN
jgi:hypothetical protein